MTAMRSPARRWIVLVTTLLAALGLGAAWVALPRTEPVPYASFVRPDGKYRVLVWRRVLLPGVMPGQSSDASGRVELWDARGRMLQSKAVEMVQLVEQVEWAKRRAHIKLIADWELPE
jgi:hypothetical protein